MTWKHRQPIANMNHVNALQDKDCHGESLWKKMLRVSSLKRHHAGMCVLKIEVFKGLLHWECKVIPEMEVLF